MSKAKTDAATLKPAQDDALIRWAGFKIASRTAGKPALWVREGKFFDQKVALKIAERQWAGWVKRHEEGGE